ncbi:MAG: type II toxin-antitoxin system RelE/ParE family toxin [Deltaproteobacteria bacterium]|jgi:mRNA interferase RelE/StbE|nr:type II toxin-antitoxin system RelE/ParE family toxin [Deltaproteobacteria bacterium]
MLKIDITKSAGKFIKKLPPKQYRQVVSTIFNLRENPTPQDSKKLIGYSEYYRVDIGEYRIIYRFDSEILYIALVGKRNDDQVYRQFKQSNR